MEQSGVYAVITLAIGFESLSKLAGHGWEWGGTIVLIRRRPDIFCQHEGLWMSQNFLSDRQAHDLNTRFENEQPQAILAWAVETYGSNLALVTSFQPTGIVTLHMLQAIAPDLPVITLDTANLFPETYGLIEVVQARFRLNLLRVVPELTLAQQAERFGDRLWERNADHCCQLRKTIPLGQALMSYDAWISGLRRDQSASRSATPIIAWDARHDMVKLCPFATWTEGMIWAYIRAHQLPYNPLHDRGYPSIGCYPCTHPMQNGADPRSGRWINNSKTECGIHLST
jgi:phosphoadenosine phosphosulfate reductase